MSDNSFKDRARRRQKATGSSYMRARREVDTAGAGGARAMVPESADAEQMLALLGLGSAGVDDIAALWAARELPVGTGEPVNLAPLLRVPLGLGAGGEPVWLDLKDEADGGAGPHLLQIGMTGSGKSVVLRSILVGLCAQHSPDLLQLVLVDAKGGEFEDFADYPHTAALLGGPEDWDRCGAALMELVDDRARALDKAGAGGRIDRYRTLRAGAEGACLPALPDVIVAVDEFRVLQSEVAGFDRVLDRLMRSGRSLGIHVVAVGQGGDVRKSAELVAYTNCRVVLRTSTAEDSQQLVGNADAYELPRGVGLYSPAPGVEAQRFRGFLMPYDLIVDLGRRFAAAAAAGTPE